MKSTQKVVARFAPSPTGFLHVGGARTVLFNYLFAKQNKGKLILRIEDTDKERSKKEYEEDILSGLKWLGLSFDETFRQSDRGDIHTKYLKKLIDSGAAYISKETPKEAGDPNNAFASRASRAEVIRFKNPNKRVKFTDLIRGDVEFDTTELKDFVIAKSLTEPIFHLAVVVDDFEMGVTHVIRGEDHISNTPRQMLIQEAIGAPTPIYAHLPLILATDRTKLSKRKHGAGVSVNFYKEQGYLPEAMLNFLALLGWNPGTAQELFSLPELIEKFDLTKVQKGGAIWNIEKLKWFNKEYLKKMKPEALAEVVEGELEEAGRKFPEEIFVKMLPIILDRISTLNDVQTIATTGEFDYFASAPEYDTKLLFWKGKTDAEKTKERLEKVSALLEKLPSQTAPESVIKEALWDYATAEGKGEVLWPLRVALSGKEKSPDPFAIAAILGKTETLTRIQTAVKKLS